MCIFATPCDPPPCRIEQIRVRSTPGVWCGCPLVNRGGPGSRRAGRCATVHVTQGEGQHPVKITGVETFIVHPKGRGKNLLFVKISTDEGIHGWGEGHYVRRVHQIGGTGPAARHLPPSARSAHAGLPTPLPSSAKSARQALHALRRPTQSVGACAAQTRRPPCRDPVTTRPQLPLPSTD